MAILGIYIKFMGCKVCEVHVMFKHHNKLLDETIILGLKVMKRHIPPRKMDINLSNPTLNMLLQLLQVQLPKIQTLPLSKTKATKNQALFHQQNTSGWWQLCVTPALSQRVHPGLVKRVTLQARCP